MCKRITKDGYECIYKWDEDCYVQSGDVGLVFDGDTSYTTAFFEAFPQSPKTFIRGEGKSIEEAEAMAWSELQRYRECKKHEFERRGYSNGAGFCKHCGLFKSHVFEPLTKCVVCNKATNHAVDVDRNFYCEEHWELIPDEKLYKSQLTMRKTIYAENIRTNEDIDRAYNLTDNMKIILKNLISNKLEENERYAYPLHKLHFYNFFIRYKRLSYEHKILNGLEYFIFTFEDSELNKTIKPGYVVKESNGKIIKLVSDNIDLCNLRIKKFK